jgi:hypothetical protein
MTVNGLGLISGTALLLCGFAGPDPRDATTHKPSPEQCAAAARDGRALPGCEVEENDGAGTAEVDEAQPRDRYMVCPGDRRCPPPPG